MHYKLLNFSTTDWFFKSKRNKYNGQVVLNKEIFEVKEILKTSIRSVAAEKRKELEIFA